MNLNMAIMANTITWLQCNQGQVICLCTQRHSMGSTSANEGSSSFIKVHGKNECHTQSMQTLTCMHSRQSKILKILANHRITSTSLFDILGARPEELCPLVDAPLRAEVAPSPCAAFFEFPS